ncbi:hypothetical protein [Streptomyces sp. WAC06614]|uniref:hypothetical protein n=1 Tax=Streptomyces sp. WAC06614 TaxID=2487416 RepID=UPI000F784656|nr:hypothetical protein [Streptomyces sp. WAC06614]RSS83829.1 hypothetical protein EF918_02550 [Streptomyces sp. WAC06614]
MRHHLLRRALVSLLAATAVTAVVPAATAAAADPTTCRPTGENGYSSDLRPGRALESGASLVPTPGKVELVMQADGNLVVYALGNPGGPKLPLWHSGTYGNPGAYALMQEDGNFVIYQQGGGPQTGGGIWHTATYGNRDNAYVHASIRDNGEFSVSGRSEDWYWSTDTSEYRYRLCSTDGSWTRGTWAQSATVWLQLQKDNNLVMYRKSDGKAIWNSGTYGNRNGLVLEMLAGGDLTLHESGPNQTVRWHTGTAGNTGAFAILQDDGNFVVYKKDGGPGKGGALWNTATYNKL